LSGIQIAPKEDETKALQKYSGPFEELSLPEQFLLVMSTVPRLNEKIHLLILVHQFEVRPFLSTWCMDAAFCSDLVHVSSVEVLAITIQCPSELCSFDWRGRPM
jgi:hypothetical protein